MRSLLLLLILGFLSVINTIPTDNSTKNVIFINKTSGFHKKFAFWEIVQPLMMTYMQQFIMEKVFRKSMFRNK